MNIVTVLLKKGLDVNAAIVIHLGVIQWWRLMREICLTHMEHKTSSFCHVSG